MRCVIPSWFHCTSLLVVLLALAGGCSSSDEAFEEAAGPPVAEPMPVSPLPIRTGGQQEEGAMSDLAARQEALRARQQEIAEHYLRLGNRYLEDGRPREAREAFANALKVQPANAEAQRLYNRVSELLGEPAPGVSAQAEEAWDRAHAQVAQAFALVREHMNKGHHFYIEGDYAKAVEHYRNAYIILQANPTLDADFNAEQVRGALESAEVARDQAVRDAEAARLREAERINAEREEKERAKVHGRVTRLWDQALAAFERERFDECERLCLEILDQDYAHPYAPRLKEAARRARHELANATSIAEHREEWQRVLEEVKSVGVVMTGDPRFPALREWEKISSRGPIQLARAAVQVNEADEEVKRRLEGTRLISLDWTDKTLDEAIRFIRANASVNINVMKAVDEVMPAEERILNLRLDDISAMAALRHAVNSLNLEFVIEDAQVKITTREAVRKRKVVEFYEVRDLTAKLNSFPGVEINLNPSGVGAGVGGFFEEDFGDGEELRTIEVDRLQELIRQTVDPTSWDEDPDNTMVDKNGTLVVRQTPENQRRIRQLLSDLRKSAGIQVQIESRFVTVENNFLEDVGVDLRGLGDNSGGVGFPGRGTSAPFDDFGLPGSASILGTDNSAGVFYNLGGGNGDIRGRTQNLFDLALGNPDVLDSSGGFSLQWAYLDDTQLEAILRATQKYERINTVTAPTLLVYNTQRANLQVTSHIAYVKDFDVEIAQASVIADPIVDVVKEGVVLDVRPIVSNDRRFVVLELRPTVATLVRPLRTFSTTLGVGTAVTFEVPELKKESLKTTVVMPDGGTLLLGGLKFYEEQDQESGIPILKDIPVLRFFFGRKGKYTNMKDLIVLLRVKIVIMEELEPSRGSGL